MNVVAEELKQITALAAKVIRYQGRSLAIDKTDYLKIIKGSFIGN